MGVGFIRAQRKLNRAQRIRWARSEMSRSHSFIARQVGTGFKVLSLSGRRALGD